MQLQDDWIGSTHQDVIDNTFLTIEEIVVTVEEVGKLRGPFEFGLTLQLSHVKHLHQRSLVTFLEVIGNIGGFNDAVWLFASPFFGMYSSLMYMRSVTNTIPFSSKKQRVKSKKLERNQELSSSVDIGRVGSFITKFEIIRIMTAI